MQSLLGHLKFAHMVAPLGKAFLLQACKSKSLHLITKAGKASVRAGMKWLRFP